MNVHAPLTRPRLDIANDATIITDTIDDEQSMRVASSSPTAIVDNVDWLGSLSALELLRDVGKHFSVVSMLARDSVKSRLQSADGISYTEFSYQVQFIFMFRL